MPKESSKATITSFTGTGLVRVIDDSTGSPQSRNMGLDNLGTALGAGGLDDRYAPLITTRFAPRAAASETAMSSPPTVTVPTANAASTITSRVDISIFNGTPGDDTVNTHGKYGVTGSPLRYRTVSGNPCVTPNFISGVSGRSYISGYFYGDLIEFRLLTAATTMPIRFFIDDEPVTATTSPNTVTSAARYRVSVAFSGVEFHKITLMIEAVTGFEGVSIGPTDVWAPAESRALPVTIVGDSFVAGTGTTNSSTEQSYAAQTGRMSGLDVNINGAGSTGFTVDGTSSSYDDASRVARATDTDPAIIVLQASTNDSPSDEATLTSAIQTTIAAYRAAAPDATIVLLGLLYPEEQSATMANINDWAVAAGNLYADYTIDPNNDPAGVWVDGTGDAGATTGDGSADVFLGSDGIHPTQAGHNYYGVRLATRLLQIAQTIAAA